MNIVLISFEFPPLTAIGGIGSYMIHLANLLTSKGNSVTVFSAFPGGKSLEVATITDCVNYRVPAEDNFEFRQNILPVFEAYHASNRVDLIESPEVGACGLLVKERFPHLRLIVKMHTPGVLITKINNGQLPFFNRLRYVMGALLRGKFDLGYWAQKDKHRDDDLEYQICIKADTLLSPSKALKQWAVHYWGIQAANITVVPNPFTLQSNLFSFPIEGRPRVISFIGKLSILKGMKNFTKAIPMILNRHKDVKILLIGRDVIEDGQSMKAYMQTELATYNNNIVFAGELYDKDLEEVYATSQVCVFPSLWENYPTVILEALAAGATVAAANTGGIPEMIKNNETGLLFDAKKSTAIANAVSHLLQNCAERHAMALRAREQLMKKITDGKNENAILDIYTN